MELLEFTGLAHKRDHLARNLPYGEQRKLEIARALASEPGLLLLDEPTAGMNPQETRATQDLVLAIRAQGIAVLVIEHDMRFIFNMCDRVAVLVQGQKLVEGTSEVVQADERVIAAYLGTPVDGMPAPDDTTDPATPTDTANSTDTATPTDPAPTPKAATTPDAAGEPDTTDGAAPPDQPAQGQTGDTP